MHFIKRRFSVEDDWNSLDKSMDYLDCVFEHFYETESTQDFHKSHFLALETSNLRSEPKN